MVDLPQNTKQTLTFTRYARKDKITGEVTYGNWNATSGLIPAYTPPAVAGYYPTPSQVPQLDVTVDPLTPDTTVNIIYRKIREVATDKNHWIDYNGNKKAINTTYELAYNEGDSAVASKQYLIAHSTATPNGTAMAIARNMKNGVNTTQTYTHLVVDDQDCYLVGDLGYVAWGAGYTANHRSPVQIELCEFDDKTRAMNAYNNYISLIQQFAKIYGIPLEVDTAASRGVKTHRWITDNVGGTDHTDPYGYLSSIGVSKAQFAKDVAGTGIITPPDDNDTWDGPGADNSGILGGNKYWHVDKNTIIPDKFTPYNGTFRNGSVAINNREWWPDTSSKTTGSLPAYATQKFDSYCWYGQYTWIHYYNIGKTGIYHQYYLPVRYWHGNTYDDWGSGVPAQHA